MDRLNSGNLTNFQTKPDDSFIQKYILSNKKKNLLII